MGATVQCTWYHSHPCTAGPGPVPLPGRRRTCTGIRQGLYRYPTGPVPVSGRACAGIRPGLYRRYGIRPGRYGQAEPPVLRWGPAQMLVLRLRSGTSSKDRSILAERTSSKHHGEAKPAPQRRTEQMARVGAPRRGREDSTWRQGPARRGLARACQQARVPEVKCTR